jgi:amidase
MATSPELAYTSAAELARAIRQRELSPVEVVDACIERIERRNPSLNAFIYQDIDDARERARRAADAVVSGQELGILHGVPTAMKDLFCFRPGWPTTFGGIRAFQDFIPDFHCVFAERIERAGAILLGKTNSPVMGFRGTCDNPLFGPTRNPFDSDLNSGGSSGGSAAAVADGMVPFAEGSDGGGSIRIPAAWCGLYGYQPSFGRVPAVVRPNAFGNSRPFLYEGPITRTVEDAALALEALAGPDPRDPFSLDERNQYSAVVRRSIRGLRVAFSPDLGVFPVEPEIAQVVSEAVQAFSDAGARVEEVRLELPYDQQELSDLWCRQIMQVNVDAVENFKSLGVDLLADHRDDLPPQYLSWLEQAYASTMADQARDYAMRTVVYDAFQGVFADHDLLVTPTLAAMPVPNADDGNTVGPSSIGGETVDELIGWCLTYFTNFTGHPAASIPAGTSRGLPVGMQLIGPRGGDATVLSASAAYERVRPWSHHFAALEQRPL